MTLGNKLISVCRDRLRRAIAILVSCAVILSGLPQGMAVAHARPSYSPAAVHHQHSSEAAMAHDDCGGLMPLHSQGGCLSELGCLMMVGIPPMLIQVSQRLSWAPVRYWARIAWAQGITAEPSLDPPIV